MEIQATKSLHFCDFTGQYNVPEWCDSALCKFQGDRWHQQLYVGGK